MSIITRTQHMNIRTLLVLNKKTARIPLVLILSLLAPFAAHGEMYKWVDENGITQYTQYPPRDGKAEKIKPPPPPAISSEEANEQLKAKTEEFDKRRATAVEQESKRNEEAARQARISKNCEIAQQNMAFLDRGRPRYREGDGSIASLTDETRQAKMQQAREQVEKFCGE